MATTYEDLRDAIESILNDIDDIGAVYDYRPHVKTDKGYLSAFGAILEAESDKQVIQAWIINSPTEGPRYRWLGGGYVRDFTFVLQGYRAIGSYEDGGDDPAEGATEKPFRALCDQVLLTFMANPSLTTNSTAHAIGFRRAPTIRTFGAINLGPILAHYVELILTPFTSCFLEEIDC